MNSKDEFQCSHLPCICPVVAEGEFCSMECKDARQTIECFCGHEPCLIDEQSEGLLVGAGAAIPAAV